MTENILQMVDSYWKFDNDQQPISNWHDKQDLLKALEELLQSAVRGRSEQLIAFSKWYEEKYRFQISEDAIKEFESLGS